MPATGKKAKELPLKIFRQKDDWASWLERNHSSSSGIWMVIMKKDAKKRSASYPEALEVALCHGWIDGQRKKHTDEAFIQKFTPRGAKSIWSKINREKARMLTGKGMMQESGLRAVENAKRNGQWNSAYDSQKTAKVPPDFRQALDANPKAMDFFETLNSANRYSFLFRIQTAKKAETREKRIREFIQMLKKKQKFHP